MGCWYEPTDYDRFRDHSGFVLESERERYNALYEPLYELIDDGGTTAEEIALDKELARLTGGEFTDMYDLSWGDQMKFISELAYERLKADIAAESAVVDAAEQVVAAVEPELVEV